MKFLIVLLATIAAIEAGADWETCKRQIDGLKTCVGEKVKAANEKNKPQVGEYFKSCEECFQDPEVQGKCEKPSWTTPSPSGVSPTPPTSVVRGTPSSETMSCLGGTKDAFVGCFKRELNISSLPAETEGQNAPQQHQGGGHQMQHFSPQQIDEFLVKICKNDTNAIKAMKRCGMKKAEPYKQALMETFVPLSLICRAKNECESENVNNKLSPECKSKVQKFVQATCTCKTEAATYFNNTASCDRMRAFVHDHASAADGHHDQFGDFCADPSKDVCEKFYENLAQYKTQNRPQ